MIAWTGGPDRGAHTWRYAVAIVAGVTSAATLGVGDSLHAQQKQKAALFQDKTEALVKRGYVELSGDDAVNFLVGNSVVIKKTDTPKGVAAVDFDSRYYLADRQTAYVCVANSCSTQSWKVDGREICVELPENCDDPTYRFYDAPRLFKAPRPDQRTGRIGIYLTFKSIVHAVVKGNATIAPLIDPSGVGNMIKVNSTDFSQEIAASSKFAEGDQKVPVKGARAISFLIGNTFISEETATDEHGGVHLCPVQGYYYSPDGRIITFNCHHWPDFWEMGITHWKLASSGLCFEDLSGNGEFGCWDRTVHLIPSNRANEWLVAADDFPRKIIGYAGNFFNFK
jgi:hypothetical protein